MYKNDSVQKQFRKEKIPHRNNSVQEQFRTELIPYRNNSVHIAVFAEILRNAL